LPADAVDDAVLQALLTIYSCTDFVERAAQSAQGRSIELRQGYERERAAIDTELRKTAEAIDRYLLAFEAGTLADTQCGERVQAWAPRQPSCATGALSWRPSWTRPRSALPRRPIWS
jgi:hypothetical protein